MTASPLARFVTLPFHQCIGNYGLYDKKNVVYLYVMGAS